jgi:hypothetical protein
LGSHRCGGNQLIESAEPFQSSPDTVENWCRQLNSVKGEIEDFTAAPRDLPAYSIFEDIRNGAHAELGLTEFDLQEMIRHSQNWKHRNTS